MNSIVVFRQSQQPQSTLHSHFPALTLTLIRDRLTECIEESQMSRFVSTASWRSVCSSQRCGLGLHFLALHVLQRMAEFQVIQQVCSFSITVSTILHGLWSAGKLSGYHLPGSFCVEFLCMSLCLHGFSLDTLFSSHRPKS